MDLRQVFTDVVVARLEAEPPLAVRIEAHGEWLLVSRPGLARPTAIRCLIDGATSVAALFVGGHAHAESPGHPMVATLGR